MGCSDSKNSNLFNVEAEYIKKALVQPWGGEYENQFEKEAFMAINLIRNDPGMFNEQIKVVRGDKLYKGSKWLLLTKALEKMGPLPQLKLNADANMACRAVNDDHIKAPREVP